MNNFLSEINYEINVGEYQAKRRVYPLGLEEIPYDKGAFSCSEIGRRRQELEALYDVYKENPMHHNVLKYWADLGLRKELYGNDGKYGFDAPYAYSVFSPLDMDAGKKYAVIYFSHAGEQPIEQAETYGFNTLAAIEKYIMIYAQNGGQYNEAVDTEFPRIIREVIEKGYPIDEERIYCAGFSSGSEASVAAACTNPELAAAVAVMPGGQPFKDLAFYTGADYYASTKGYRIPGIFIGGTLDIENFPARWLTEYYGNELPVGTVENAVKNLDIWARDIAKVKNYAPLTREGITDLLLNSTDPVEQEFGLKFDFESTFRAEGVNWLGGDILGEDDAPVMRFARAEGVPHIVWESQANLVWDYLKHFRREKDTGASIYDPVVCWGER